MRKFNVTVNGTAYEVCVEEIGGQTVTAAPAQTVAPVAKAAPAPAAAPVAKPVAPGNGTKVTAPMPGTILRTIAKNGQTVKKGDVICVLEAMKMENDIVSACDGVLTLYVSENKTVASGDIIAVIA